MFYNFNCQIYFDKYLEIKLIKLCNVTIFILRINMYSSMFQAEFISFNCFVADTTVPHDFPKEQY